MERLESVRVLYPVAPPGSPGAAVQVFRSSEYLMAVTGDFVRVARGTHVVRIPLTNVVALTYTETPIVTQPERRTGRAGRA